MPTYFDSLIYIYEIGFDKFDELPEEVIENIYIARESEINLMMEKQFILSYFANISKEDSDNMTPTELDRWIDLVKKRKELEAEQLNENLGQRIT